MSPPWSNTDITTVEVVVEYEEDYDRITFDNHNNTVSPDLQDLCILLDRSLDSVYVKVMYCCKISQDRARFHKKKKFYNVIHNPVNNLI
jgi:hypothetical protein